MRVVLQSGSRVIGGNEKWLVTVGRGLRARGYDVTLSAPAGELRARADAAGLPTTGHRPRGFEPLSLLDFARWLRRHRADVLVLSRWIDKLPAALAGRLASVRRVVLRLGIARSLSLGRAGASAFRGLIDDVIVNSRHIKDVLAGSAPWFPTTRVHVVLNAVEPPPTLDAARRLALRAEMGAGAGDVLITGAGHVSPRKGFDLLLRAFAEARPVAARVAIVGDGPQLGELQRLAGALGVFERVRFLGRRDDAASLIAASDLFVLSSRNEGMANVLLEAMASGVPVVSTDVSGARESIGEWDGRGTAGWIVPPDDVEALSGTLAAVVPAALGRGDGVMARVEEARWRARHWFGEGRMLDDVERVLRSDWPND
jgi:glycosyltransferase involved in cell wall biosynthesis